MKSSQIKLLTHLKQELLTFSISDIENGIMLYCLTAYGCDASIYKDQNSQTIAAKLTSFGFPTDLETITDFFELLLDRNDKTGKGIVFTPQYIAEYITFGIFKQKKSPIDKARIIDPGCGCGNFLIAAAEKMLAITNHSIDSIIENNIYGIDIVEDNVRRCKLIMKLLSAKHGGKYQNLKDNIICKDSLKSNWSQVFGVKNFDFIIGNPPYVNPHDMDKKTAEFLKRHYATTKNGVFNIFYAFIEKGIQQLDPQGILSFILPNNFLTIKSALVLREYLQTNSFIKQILDFGNNMIFKPVRTYNCIVQLSKTQNSLIEYCVLPKVSNIKNAISSVHFAKMNSQLLNKNAWQLLDEKTYKNIHKIEHQPISLKTSIRTGIATLRDSVYFVEKDEGGYYKCFSDKKLYIESQLVKPIYKISELKSNNRINEAKRYIIFPYIKSNVGYTLIDEQSFINNYPKTYKCLSIQRKELDARDKGKGIAQGWYAYGRTQGLNKYGSKILFPTFSNTPKFIYVKDKDALFCNGYAIFENGKYDLDILVKILNSKLMDYYISKTSYSIEGGFYCYQKKYIERFSLPAFSEKELRFIRKASQEKLNNFLWARYELD